LSERRGSYAGDGEGEKIFIDHLDSSVSSIQRIDRMNLLNDLVERLSRIKKQNFNFRNQVIFVVPKVPLKGKRHLVEIIERYRRSEVAPEIEAVVRCEWKAAVFGTWPLPRLCR